MCRYVDSKCKYIHINNDKIYIVYTYRVKKKIKILKQNKDKYTQKSMALFDQCFRIWEIKLKKKSS